MIGGCVVQLCFVKNFTTSLADRRWSEGGPGGEFLSGRQSSNARVPPGKRMRAASCNAPSLSSNSCQNVGYQYNVGTHCCPVKSRKESVGWHFRRNWRFGRWPEVRIKSAISRKA